MAEGHQPEKKNFGPRKPGGKPPFKGKPKAGGRPGSKAPFKGPKKFDGKPRPARDEAAGRPPRPEVKARPADVPAKPKGMNRRALLQLTAELLFEFRAGNSPADRHIADYFRKRKFLGAADRSFIGDVFFETLRNLRRYDEAISSGFQDQFVVRARPSAGFPMNQAIGAKSWESGGRSGAEGKAPRWYPSDRVVDTLRVGLAALEIAEVEVADLCGELTRAWPKPPEVKATGEESPEEAPVTPGPRPKSPIKNIPERAVIRMTERTVEVARGFAQPGRLIDNARRYSFPDWLWAQLSVGREGAELEALAQALLRPAPVTLRLNTLRTSVEELSRSFSDLNIPFTRGTLVPEAILLNDRVPRLSLPGSRDGWFEFQDEGSQLISVYTGAKPGMTVVDACAGAGGKTLHLGALMNNQGRIYAFDVEDARLSELRRRIPRSGVTIIEEPRATPTGRPVPPDLGRLDVVLIDAPCSGTGTMRRSPDRRWRLTQYELETYRQTQHALMDAWSEAVPVGGAIVYTTCSLLAAENQMQVDEFLKTHGNFALEAPEEIKAPLTTRGELSVDPGAHGCDGFYAARLVRKS